MVYCKIKDQPTGYEVLALKNSKQIKQGDLLTCSKASKGKKVVQVVPPAKKSRTA
jgi:hypothetical protein